jgi:hypothetical protein
VVADEPAGEADQDRRQGRAPWPLCHLPDGRGRGAEGIIWGDSTADRRTETTTGPSVGTGTVGCVITTGGACPNDEEKRSISLSGRVQGGQHAGSVPDTALRLPSTTAECYRSRGFLAIGGISVYEPPRASAGMNQRARAPVHGRRMRRCLEFAIGPHAARFHVPRYPD